MKVIIFHFQKRYNPGYDLRNIILYSRLKNIKLYEYDNKFKNEYMYFHCAPSFDPTI